MNGRKTFNVAEFKKKVNMCLKDSTCTPAERLAMGSLLEHVLLETNNYHGFQYLEDVVGTDGKLLGTGDDSRRMYF